MLAPRHASKIAVLPRTLSRKWKIKVYRFANVGNHLHIVIHAKNRAQFQGFLRELTGKIALLITKGRKGNPVGKFWDELAWSRVLSWGRDFKTTMDYLVKNLFEAAGMLNAPEKRANQVVTIRSARAPAPS